MKRLIVALILLSLLSSCTGKDQTDSAIVAAIGALIGQAINHHTDATLIGAAFGGIIGYVAGSEMCCKQSCRKPKHIAKRLLPRRHSPWVNIGRVTPQSVYHTYNRTHPRSAWVNTGSQYAVASQPAYQNYRTPQTCRRAVTEAIIDGRPQRVISTTCRDQYGPWQLQ